MKRTYFNIHFKTLSFRSLPGYRQRAAKQQPAGHSCQTPPIAKEEETCKDKHFESQRELCTFADKSQ